MKPTYRDYQDSLGLLDIVGGSNHNTCYPQKQTQNQSVILEKSVDESPGFHTATSLRVSLWQFSFPKQSKHLFPKHPMEPIWNQPTGRYRWDVAVKSGWHLSISGAVIAGMWPRKVAGLETFSKNMGTRGLSFDVLNSV